jgi:hypothetical protein
LRLRDNIDNWVWLGLLFDDILLVLLLILLVDRGESTPIIVLAIFGVFGRLVRFSIRCYVFSPT